MYNSVVSKKLAVLVILTCSVICGSQDTCAEGVFNNYCQEKGHDSTSDAVSLSVHCSSNSGALLNTAVKVNWTNEGVSEVSVEYLCRHRNNSLIIGYPIRKMLRDIDNGAVETFEIDRRAAFCEFYGCFSDLEKFNCIVFFAKNTTCHYGVEPTIVTSNLYTSTINLKSNNTTVTENSSNVDPTAVTSSLYMTKINLKSNTTMDSKTETLLSLSLSITVFVLVMAVLVFAAIATCVIKGRNRYKASRSLTDLDTKSEQSINYFIIEPEIDVITICTPLENSSSGSFQNGSQTTDFKAKNDTTEVESKNIKEDIIIYDEQSFSITDTCETGEKEKYINKVFIINGQSCSVDESSGYIDTHQLEGSQHTVYIETAESDFTQDYQSFSGDSEISIDNDQNDSHISVSFNSYTSQSNVVYYTTQSPFNYEGNHNNHTTDDSGVYSVGYMKDNDYKPKTESYMETNNCASD